MLKNVDHALPSPLTFMTEESIGLFRRNLVQWYQKHKRKLPWREYQDPYAIWVSEIMLQQTQVVTVIPYYEKFLKRFPTVQALADADQEAVLAAWAGLGYYRRAKLLHQGAKMVVTEYAGRLPSQATELQKLPSIGPYTAGAIASIAFQQAAPLVDGNVVRVLSRIFAEQGHAKSPTLQKKIWKYAAQLVDPENPGDFNQALMELGATVCRVHLPSCERCPLQSQCGAFRLGDPEVFPETPPAAKTLKLFRKVAVCLRDGKLLLVKRHQSRWFQGMWELPQEFWDPSTDIQDNPVAFLEEHFGVEFEGASPLSKTQHGITHHRIVSQAWQGNLADPSRIHPMYEKIAWVSWGALEDYALPSFDRKVLQAGSLIGFKMEYE